MSESKWEDGTLEGVVISSELRIVSLKAHIHRSPLESPDIWLLTFAGIRRRLESKDLELAKLQAVAIVSIILEAALGGLEIEAGLSESIEALANVNGKPVSLSD